MYPKVKVPVIKIRNKFSFPFLSIAVFSKFATRSQKKIKTMKGSAGTYPRAVQLTWSSGGLGMALSGMAVVSRTGSLVKSRPKRRQGPVALDGLPSSHSGSEDTL